MYMYNQNLFQIYYIIYFDLGHENEFSAFKTSPN